MPVHKVAGGGAQWGAHGKVYKGKNAVRKAYAQAAAAAHNGYKEPRLGANIPKKK